MAKSELEIIIGLTDKTKGPLGGLTRNLQNIGKIAGGIALGGVVALGAGVAKLASEAIPAASDLQESMNATSVVFEDAAKKVQDFGKTAAETTGLSAAEFNQMGAQIGAMLQNFGLAQDEAADQTINLAQRAADMASIFNTDVNEAMTAIAAALRGEADPIERFGVSMNEAAVKAKALELGLEDADGQLSQSAKTTARLALLFEQTDKIAGDFVNTSGDLANAQRVARAQWENFMASVGKLALPVLGKVFSFLSNNLIPSLQNMFNLLVTGDFSGGIFGLTEDHPFIDALFRIRETLLGVGEAFSNFFGFIRQGSDLLSSLTRLVYDLAIVFGATSEDAMGLANTFYDIVTAAIDLKDRILEFIAPLIEWAENNITIKDVLIALGVVIASVVIPAILSLLASLLPIILIGAALIAAVTLVRKAWEENWGGIQEKTGAVIDWVSNAINTFLNWIQDFWGKHGDQIIATVQMIWDTIQKVTKSTVDWIRNAISSFLKWVEDFWNKHGEQIASTVQALWDGVVAIFEWFRDYFTVIFEAWSAAFSGDWETFGEKIREAWDMVWELIVTAVERAWDFIKTAVSNGIQAIIKWFHETDWKQVGIDLVRGIANGISAGVSWVISAVRGVARAAWDAIRSFFDAKSPSRLMATLGEDISRGLGLGISDSVQIPVKAMTDIGKEIANTFDGFIPDGQIGANLVAATAQGGTGAIPGTYAFQRGGDNNFVFVQNSAAWAAWVDQQQQTEFDEIDRSL
jgi:phage-related protein